MTLINKLYINKYTPRYYYASLRFVYHTETEETPVFSSDYLVSELRSAVFGDKKARLKQGECGPRSPIDKPSIKNLNTL